MTGFANDPAGFIDALERQAARMKAEADRAREALATASFTASSRDKAVTVTVSSGGTLTGIEFGVKAKALTQLQLAGSVMETYGKAAAEAGRASRNTIAGLVGDGSEVLGLFDAVAPRDPEPERRPSW